jgi:hypothetical protein
VTLLSVVFTIILVIDLTRDLFLPTISVCSLSDHGVLPEYFWLLRAAQGSAHPSLGALRVCNQGFRHAQLLMPSDCSCQLQKQQRSFCWVLEHT